MTLTDTQHDHVPDVEAQTQETAQPAVAAKRTRETRTSITGSVLTISDRHGEHEFDMTFVPGPTQAYLAMVGLRFTLSNTDEPSRRWEEIRSGLYAGRKPAAPKPPKAPRPLNLNRQAIANAMVAQTKRSPAPLTQQQAEDRVRAMSGQEVTDLMTDETVVRHLGKLTGRTGLLAEKLAAPAEAALAEAAE